MVSTASLSGPNGLATTLARELGDLCVGQYSGMSAHSPREGVIAAADEARRTEADLLVAIGGGSVIDATKVVQLALWARLTEAEQLSAYRAGRADDRWTWQRLAAGVRMIAIPTTPVGRRVHRLRRRQRHRPPREGKATATSASPRAP